MVEDRKPKIKFEADTAFSNISTIILENGDKLLGLEVQNK